MNNHSKRFVGKRHHHILHRNVGQPQGPSLARCLIEQLEELGAREHSQQAPFTIDHREQVLAPGMLRAANEVARFVHSCIAGQRHDVGAHHFLHKQNLEWIERVLAAQMISAARNFLGQNGSLERKHGEEMGKKTRHHQRQKHVDVVRQFKGQTRCR